MRQADGTSRGCPGPVWRRLQNAVSTSNSSLWLLPFSRKGLPTGSSQISQAPQSSRILGRWYRRNAGNWTTLSSSQMRKPRPHGDPRLRTDSSASAELLLHPTFLYIALAYFLKLAEKANILPFFVPEEVLYINTRTVY